MILMAKQQQQQAPQGMAGLVRYYDEDKSLIKMKPEHVMALCAALAVVEIMLHMLV